MAFDRFISSVRSEVARRFNFKTDAEIDAFFIGMEQSAKDNQEALEKRDEMLRDTVSELCEAKLLLKAAVEDFEAIGEVHAAPTPMICPKYGDYMRAIDIRTRKWRYTDEALKLIGDEKNEKDD